MVLSSLAPAERTELLRGMSDEEAAICLAAMSLNTRTAVIADLAAADASLVACALACVWYASCSACPSSFTPLWTFLWQTQHRADCHEHQRLTFAMMMWSSPHMLRYSAVQELPNTGGEVAG